MRNKGFTMVEVVVVMIILGILGTISFMSFISYIVESRDSKRVVDLESIASSLEIYYKKNSGVYPKPSDSVIISYTGSNGQQVPFSYLGFIKNDLKLDFNSVPRDPLTENYYVYGLTVSKKYYELAATMETTEKIKSEAFIPSANAAGQDVAYLIGNYRQDSTKGNYLKHLIFLEVNPSTNVSSIPRTDVNIGVLDGSGTLVIDLLPGGTGDKFTIMENGSANVAYPINSDETFASSDTAETTSEFMIEVTQTGIPLMCPDCEVTP